MRYVPSVVLKGVMDPDVLTRRMCREPLQFALRLLNTLAPVHP